MRVSEPVFTGVGGPLVRKPTRCASSAPEVLKRVGHSEGLPPRDPQWRGRGKLGGVGKTTLAAKYPPT
eukprot:165963-Alexandrium_andersonii.AAC.1